jgi:hypothetical protein
MNGQFLVSALAIISVLTSLTVQAIKKLLDEKGMTYSSNVLAAVTAVALTAISAIGYVIYTGTAVNAQVIITALALMFLSFLGSTVGYDKVVQLIKQLGEI